MTINQNGLSINSVKDLQMLLVNAGNRSFVAHYQIDDTANAKAIINAFAEAGSEIAKTVIGHNYHISDKQAWAMAFGAVEHGLIQID